MSISPLSAPGGESLLEDPRLGPTHDTPLEPESHTSSSERTMLENLNSANDPELQALVGAADEHDSSAGSFLVGTSPGSPRSDAAQRKQPFLRAADGTHARHPAELHDSAACGNGASTLITVVDTAPRRDSDDSSAHRQWNCGGINTMSLAPAPPARANPADPARAERGHSFLSPEELARRFPNLYAPKKPEVAPDAQPAAPTRPPRLAEPHAETGAEPNKHGAMMHGSPSLHTTSSNSYPLQFHTGLSKLSESRDDHPSIRLDKVHRRVGGEAVSSDSRHEQHTRPRPVNIHPPRKTESSNPTHGSSGDQQVSTTSSGGSNMSPSFLSPPVKLDEVFSYSPINQTGNKGIVQGPEYQQGGFGATGRPYPPRNPAAANFADVPTSVGTAQEHFGQESAVPSAWGQGNFPTASQPMRHPFLGDMSSSPTTPPSVPLAPSVMGDAQYRQCMALCAQMFFSLQQQQNTHNPAAAAMLGEFSTAVVGPETFGMDPGAASMWCQANSGATAFARNPYLGGMMAPTMPGNGNACMNDPQLLNCMSLCAQMFLTLQAQQQQQQQVQMSTMAAMMDESSMNPARPGTLSPLYQAAGFLPTDQRNPTYARTDLSGVFGAFPSADGFGVNGSRHAFSSAAAAAAAAALSNISSQGPTSPEGQSDPPTTRPNNFRGDRQAADKSIRERETLSHSKSSNRAPRQGNYSQQQQNGRSAKDDTKGSRGKTQSTSQSKQKANNKPNPRKTDQSQPQTPHKKLYFSTDPFSVYGHNKSLVESSAN